MAQSVSPPGDWRAHVDRELRRRHNAVSRTGGPVSDDEWALLLDDGTVRELGQGRTPASVADTVVRWRRAHPVNQRSRESLLPATSGRRTNRHLAWHEEAVSDVLASHAERETIHRFGVKEFRNEVLGGRLVELDNVAMWIETHTTREGPPIATTTIGPDGRRSRGIETLGYMRPGSKWMHRAPVRAGGILARLRAIIKRLEAFYGWDEAQATVFVLTGITPMIRTIRATVTTSSPLLVRSRITLSIDPSTAPREVADYYRRVRQEGFGRIRRLGEKHARLAAFVAGLRDELTAAEQMDLWNAECATWKRRKWQFKHPSRFATDAQKALDRLVELGKV